ncbi:MAG: DASS family sodium-coupled anion symporter, partial [Enterobacteriaceae bacterium]
MSGATIVSPASQTRRSIRGLIILGIDIVLLIILLNTLPFDSKANMGLGLLAFIGVLWLTEAIHITITALLIPIMAVGMGLLEVNKALSSFSDPIIFLFFGGFALATALHIQEIDKLIANRILMLAKGKMLWATMLLFGITAALSMWISNTATAAMMLPLAMGVLSKMDRNKEHNTYVFMLLGIAYSASIGGLGTLVGSPPNAIAAAQLGMNFWDWMKVGLPMMLVLMPVMIAVLYFVFRPNLQQKFEIELEHLEWT